MSQENLINKTLKKFGMHDCNKTRSPMEKGLQLTTNIENECNEPYRELLGSLMYIMLSVRPDICYSVGYMGRFQQKPGDIHWLALKRILRYIKGSTDLKLTYNRNLEETLVGYADADWGSNLDDRKSTSGYIFYVFGNPVSWSSKKQATVAISSSEAEYIALSYAISEGLGFRGVLQDLNIIDETYPVMIFEDNAECISMAKNVECKRSKHIDIPHHFIRDHITRGNLLVKPISTKNQIADIFTKSLDTTSFNAIKNLLKLFN